MNTLQAGDIVLHKNTHRVFRGTEEVKLTATEFALLAWLLEHKGYVCSRDDIIEGVWGIKFHYDTGGLDVHMGALRRKLGINPSTGFIRTVRGTGFIIPDDTPAHSETPSQANSGPLVLPSVHPEAFHALPLAPFFRQLLTAHAILLEQRQLHVDLRLDPFVSEITTDEEVFHDLLTHLLEPFFSLMTAGTTLSITSGWAMHAFVFTLEGLLPAATPLPQTDGIVKARCLAALLGMSLLMEKREETLHVELSTLMKKE